MTGLFGPRREGLLTAWGELIAETSSGSGFDCTDSNRTEVTQRQVSEFLQEPSVDRFEKLWQVEVLADAVFGGPSPVLDRFGSIEQLAETIRSVAEADAYDPDWEEHFLTPTVVWELYGRLHPDQAPILNSTSATGLSDLGLLRPRSFEEAEEEWATFRGEYESLVGHATANTSHTVPINHEISELLWFVATTDAEVVTSRLQDVTEEYTPIAGWQDEAVEEPDIKLAGHERHLEGYIDAVARGGFKADGRGDLWNQGYWEDWKDDYLTHIEESVKPTYDLRQLSPDEVGPLLDNLTARATLESSVPSYLLGGRSGGILWSGFRSHSEEHVDEAADVLSYLFDENESISLRLDRFAGLYGDLEVTGGPLMSLATMLLGFIYPTEYVFYKYSLMNGFFGRYGDYDVRQGFNPSQYWKLNLACRSQVLEPLAENIDSKSPTMWDVYTLLYVWAGNYAD